MPLSRRIKQSEVPPAKKSRLFSQAPWKRASKGLLHLSGENDASGDYRSKANKKKAVLWCYSQKPTPSDKHTNHAAQLIDLVGIKDVFSDDNSESSSAEEIGEGVTEAIIVPVPRKKIVFSAPHTEGEDTLATFYQEAQKIVVEARFSIDQCLKIIEDSKVSEKAAAEEDLSNS